jgi:hypothetical protein
MGNPTAIRRPSGEIAMPKASPNTMGKSKSIVGGGVKCSAPAAAASPVIANHSAARPAATIPRRRDSASARPLRRDDQ